MSHSEICPVCRSKGKIENVDSKFEVNCHGCNGQGWISVPDEVKIEKNNDGNQLLCEVPTYTTTVM